MIINGVKINTIEELEAAIVDLPGASKTALRSVFGQVKPNTLRIYSLLEKSDADTSKPPFGVDYVTGLNVKLHRKQTMIKGEVKEELFYKKFDGTIYSELVVKELHTYARDPMGFAKHKTTTISWINEDDTECPFKKTWVKYYDPLQMIEEGIDRRANIVKSLQPKVLKLLQMTLPPNEMVNLLVYGRAFLSEMKNHFENFINHSDRQLYAELKKPELVTQFPWLNNLVPGMGPVTILMFITNEVTI